MFKKRQPIVLGLIILVFTAASMMLSGTTRSLMAYSDPNATPGSEKPRSDYSEKTVVPPVIVPTQLEKGPSPTPIPPTVQASDTPTRRPALPTKPTDYPFVAPIKERGTIPASATPDGSAAGDPFISVSARCNADQTVEFVIANASTPNPPQGDMTEPGKYGIRFANSTTVSGKFLLRGGQSITFNNGGLHYPSGTSIEITYFQAIANKIQSAAATGNCIAKSGNPLAPGTPSDTPTGTLLATSTPTATATATGTVTTTLTGTITATLPVVSVAGQCSDGHATFWIYTDNFGDLGYTVTTADGRLVSGDAVYKVNGVVGVADQYGQTLTLKVLTSGGQQIATVTTTCGPRPTNQAVVTASGSCQNGTATFAIVTQGFNLTYNVTSQSGTVVSSGNVPGNGVITIPNSYGRMLTLTVYNLGAQVATAGATCSGGGGGGGGGGLPAATATPRLIVATATRPQPTAVQPTAVQPTVAPPTVAPPTVAPTASPVATLAAQPTGSPTVKPTIAPTGSPTVVALAPSATPAPGVSPLCGIVIRDANGFPFIDTTNCGEDTSAPPRAPWTPVDIGTETCQDWFAYASNSAGPNRWDILRRNVNQASPDEAPVNLTKSNVNVDSIQPAISPDRNTIAFVSNRDGNWEIYVAPANGNGPAQRVTYNTFAADLDPVWSPDGRFLVYSSNRRGHYDLFLMDITAGPDSEVQLTSDPANNVNPVYSPDGSKIYYETTIDGKSQIYVLNLSNLADLKPVRVSDGAGADYNPTVSRQGDKIAYRSYRGDGRIGVLYVANADGSSPKPVSDPSATALNQVWSPSGNYVAYQSNLGGVTSVYVTDLQGGKTRLVTDKAMADKRDALSYAPAWRCGSDDTLIITSDVSGTPNLYRIPALPIDSPAIKVDSDPIAVKLTNGKNLEKNLYPEDSPNEEDASTLGLAPFGGRR